MWTCEATLYSSGKEQRLPLLQFSSRVMQTTTRAPGKRFSRGTAPFIYQHICCCCTLDRSFGTCCHVASCFASRTIHPSSDPCYKIHDTEPVTVRGLHFLTAQ